MAYSEAVIRRARRRLAEAKDRREAEYAGQLAEAYEKFPRLCQIDRQLRRTAAEAVCTSLSRGSDPAAAIDALKEKSLRLQQERKALLDAAEKEGVTVNDAPVCPLCGGSGYVGAKMCSCLQELCRQEQNRELTALFVTGQECFENFSLDYYSDAYDENWGASARQLMRCNLNYCKKYAAAFGGKSGSLLFVGATGLGKTFLSACIARQVADAGFWVVYETAGAMFADFEAVKFGGDEDGRTRKYLDCDLLIVDDLGTEMKTQFTISALYSVVNSRLTAGKSTIISTNLFPESLERTYSPQIASRLLGSYELLQFAGSDIRMQRLAQEK